jgi:hypothetical protein
MRLARLSFELENNESVRQFKTPTWRSNAPEYLLGATSRWGSTAWDRRGGCLDLSLQPQLIIDGEAWLLWLLRLVCLGIWRHGPSPL